MGRPKKARVHFAGVDTAGASSAAAAATEFGLPGADADDVPRATDSWSSEDDDEAAEFRREAAELLKQKQRQNNLPGGLQQKQLDNAIKHFVSQTGISKAEAEDALLATAEQHCQDFENWVNEALVWLAVQGEVQDEAAKLKEAMEVSLREQQAARQAEEAAAPPLANLSEERLRKRFPGSAMLARLGALLPGSVLFSDRPPVREQVKHKLVEFLRLEADCMKWWPSSGTKTFFDDLAGKVHDELSQASGSNGSVTGMAAGAGTAGAAAAALSLGMGQTTQGPAATALQALGPLQASVAAAGPDGAGGLQDSSADAAGPSAGAAAAAAAAAGPGSCRQSPESDVLSDPCSSAADDDSFGAASTGLRASTRKRQPPARYRSPSPATGTRRKRPQQESPDCQQPAKRHASLDCHAAAAHDSMTARRSASPSPACVETKEPAAPDNMQQRDGGGSSQRPQGALPPLPPLQQHLLVAQQQQQWQQQRLPPLPELQPAVVGAGISAVQASMVACLSQLLDEELQHIRHHVFNMPEKACAVPIIFQSPEEQQPQQDAGDDSDVELVDVKAPQGVQDIPDPVEPPAPTHAVTPPQATAAAAAAAAAAGVPAAAAAAAAAGVPAAAAAAAVAATAASGLPAAAAGMAAALQGTSSAAAMAAAAAAGAGPNVPAATGAMLLTPRFSGGSTAEGMGGFPFAMVDEQLHYRATTNEQGTLVIEID